ncbi:MAG: dicarboxylate/amino acid:cation symporter [Bacteroidales bacterium]
MKRLQLHWQILIGLVLGILYGMYLPEHIDYVAWMGELFLRGLKMVIVPLILSSIITGVANIGSAQNLGRLGLKTIGYYLITSTLAIVTGLFFVNIFKPGIGSDLGFVQEVQDLALSKDSLGQTLIKVIPTNIFTAFTEGQMLSIIFFSVLFGFFITQAPSRPKKVLSDFFSATFEVMMKITMFVVKFTPLGVFGIVAYQVSKSPDILALGQRMGVYMLTVIIALAVHAVITLPLLLRFVGRVNPFRHFRAVSAPLLTAFSTASSSATLPLTMEAVEHKSGVSNKITSFTLPLGATINMDGTALYECIAAIFIAQAYGIELSVIQQVIVVVTALLASIGAAGIPMAGLVMITVILTAVGLPLEGVGLILAVDQLLDMFRTSVNVWSDTCGATIIARSEGETLQV